MKFIWVFGERSWMRFFDDFGGDLERIKSVYFDRTGKLHLEQSIKSNGIKYFVEWIHKYLYTEKKDYVTDMITLKIETLLYPVSYVVQFFDYRTKYLRKANIHHEREQNIHQRINIVEMRYVSMWCRKKENLTKHFMFHSVHKNEHSIAEDSNSQTATPFQFQKHHQQMIFIITHKRWKLYAFPFHSIYYVFQWNYIAVCSRCDITVIGMVYKIADTASSSAVA